MSNDEEGVPPIGNEDETMMAMTDACDTVVGMVPTGREVAGYAIMILTVPVQGGGEGVVQAIYQIQGAYSDQLPRMLADFRDTMAHEVEESSQ